MRRTRRRMGLELPTLRPLVGFVVVIDVTEQEASLTPVDDQSQIAPDTHGPEVLVSRFVQPMEAQTRVRRIDLQVEGGRLDRFLFVARQPGKAVGEGVCDSQVHARQPICCTKAPCAACGTGVTAEIAAWRSTTETKGSSPATAPS